MADMYIITGASRGLGLEMAKLLHRQGALLLLVARGEIHINGHNVVKCAADLSKPEGAGKVIEVFAEMIEDNVIDSISLINNAGAVQPVKFAQRCSSAETLSAINVNLTAVIQLCCGFLEKTDHLDCTRRILNISSGAATSAYPGWSHYCAAKAGIDHFTRCLGEEQQSHANPVLAVSLAPGVIDTEMQSVIRQADTADFPDLPRFIELKESGELVPADTAARQTLSFFHNDDLENGQKYDIRHFRN